MQIYHFFAKNQQKRALILFSNSNVVPIFNKINIMILYSQDLYVSSITNATKYEDLILIMDVVFKEASLIIKQYGNDYYNTLVTIWQIKEADFIKISI